MEEPGRPLAPCKENIYRDGKTVFVIPELDKYEIEKWCRHISNESGQPVDWHYYGGRANILALGDLEKVECAIKKSLPELNKARKMYSLYLQWLHQQDEKNIYKQSFYPHMFYFC